MSSKKKNFEIKISLLSSKQLRNISYGEIFTSNTLDYKKLKPEIGGLFCEKVFSSIDNDCFCGNTNNFDDFNFMCEGCSVEIPAKKNNFRRRRLGHIKLNDFFLNSLYYKSFPYYLSLILNISQNDLINILHNDFYIVFYSLIKTIKTGNILSSSEYMYYKNKHYNKIHAETGYESIINKIKSLDLSSELKNYEKIFKFNSYFFKKKYFKKLKRYKFLKILDYTKLNISNIFLKNLMVLPPDLRPILKLPNDTIVSSDLNELYKRIINKNIRLKLLKENVGIPDIIISNEKRIIQKSIDNLITGGGLMNKKSLKSFSDNLKGKKGFFRQNLLGKRVDFSGRAVITSGPNLNIGECAIPKNIAIELFRPFIYNVLLLDKRYNMKMAELEVNRQEESVMLILKKILKRFYVLLNRAPTLHRLGMQAFKVLLTDDNAIKLHPLNCPAFNADFDGDQMAIHIPLTSKSSLEFRNLLFSNNNILYPSNGSCCITPTKDAMLGIYISTKLDLYNKFKKDFFFNNLYEILLAYEYRYIDFNTIIYIRFKEIFKNNINYKIYKTTLGRAIIFNMLPLPHSYKNTNKILKKEDISKILDFFSYKYNFSKISEISHNLMRVGFNFVTKSGFSISIDDMFFCYSKKNILIKSKSSFITYNIDYLNFFLTKNSKKKKILNLWDSACDIISNIIIRDISFTDYLDSNCIFVKNQSSNPMYEMMMSGARGSKSQIKQICSNRGLIDYKIYGLLEMPVLNSLRDGLNVFEYFYFSHNSRKTLADTALKTASAGYLTRRLVESSNHVFISEYDCKTNKGFLYKSLIYEGFVIEDFFDRIFGKFTLEDLNFKDFFLKKNTLINNDVVIFLKKCKIDSMLLRTPLKCKSKNGICVLCYGMDLGKARIVNIGEMVGIVAAQSIGEPGTQLTMRTFHTGGAINKFIKNSFFKSNTKGYLKYSTSLKYVLNKEDFKVVVSKIGKIIIYNKKKQELESFIVPYGSYLFFNNKSKIKKGDLICKWDSNYNFIISEHKGFIKFFNFFENLNFINRIDIDYYEIMNYKILPYIIVSDNGNSEEYKLKPGYIVSVTENQKVEIGDILVKIPLDFNISKDIIGGLPKVDNFFEARIPKDCAILATSTGFLNFNFTNNKKVINIINKNNSILSVIKIPFNKNLIVFDKQHVKKGEALTSGDINPHDILELHGTNKLINFLLKEIKYIYSFQGVKISDKHIEIILSQMLKYGKIISPGKTNFLPGEIILIKDIKKINIKLERGRKIKYNKILLGITKKSLKNKSFLSAASFQRTDFILSKSAIKSQSDNMKSLKNMIMTGRVFKAGTGVYSKILKF